MEQSGLIGVFFFVVRDEMSADLYFAVMPSHSPRCCFASFNYSVLAEM